MKHLFVFSLFFPIVVMLAGAVSASNETEDISIDQEDQESNQTDDESVDIKKVGQIDDESTLFKKNNDQTKKDELQSVLDTVRQNVKQKKILEPKQPTQTEPRKIHRNRRFYVIAKVNGDIVTNVDIQNDIRFIYFSSNRPVDQKAWLMYESVLRKNVQNKLQEQVAKSNKFEISESVLNDKFREIATMNNITVKDLEAKLEAIGIGVQIFRKNMKSSMLYTAFVNFARSNVYVPHKAIEEAKKMAVERSKQKRYNLAEIHLKATTKKEKEDARRVAGNLIELLNDGFNFQVLAESTSQGNYPSRTGDLGWVTPSDLTGEVQKSVLSMKLGEISPIIETSSGLKLVQLKDIAEPNKKGDSEASYQYMKVDLQCDGPLMTSVDIKKVNETVEELQKTRTPVEFEGVCKKYGLNVVHESESWNPDLKQMLEVAMEKVVIIQSEENKNTIKIYRSERKDVPDADSGSLLDARNSVVSKIAAKDFKKDLARLESSSFIEIDHKKKQQFMQEL
jgi:parvulin-like peptidyl-prolyl isomerase